MAITVKDIHEKEFSKQVRGYSIDEVDDFLDELAEQMEVMIKENREALAEAEAAKAELAQLKAEKSAAVAAPVVVAEEPKSIVAVAPAQPVQQSAAIDEPQYFKNLETTLRETLISAQRLADETVADARKKANAMIASAEEQAANVTAAAKAEVETHKSEAEELKKAAEDYRARFLRLLEDQAHILKADDSLFAK
ncbi:MAG: DivIVA domain-containing protein [Clostridiales bacterium]|nr:DivIVA domain-containing protein [Clostridiales bacterium]MDY2872945.1 DivIVA domain-containing protein [Eubacteriales bacterium]